ncbi:MAG: WbqC family protein [Proteiniphilum sp.]|jgi:hypothetical protein|nr:WbqC family protein [Proteiniphilum sp.]
MNNQERSQRVLLSSFYLAPVEYYSRLHGAESAVMEIHDNYRKQSYRNRCTIAGANGPLSLSIPVEKPTSPDCRMKDIRIATHGNWQHLHWNAIISAYNSSPFFQYYEEDFRPFYEKKFTFLHDFNEELRRLLCRLIGIETTLSFTSSYVASLPEYFSDLRETIHPKKRSDYATTPYYQVFAGRHGFIPNLSIIDLLFNMGNESRLFL